MPLSVMRPRAADIVDAHVALPLVSPPMISLSVLASSPASTVLKTIVPSAPLKLPATLRVWKAEPSPREMVPLRG